VHNRRAFVCRPSVASAAVRRFSVGGGGSEPANGRNRDP